MIEDRAAILREVGARAHPGHPVARDVDRVEDDAVGAPRLLALLAEAERHAMLTEAARPGTAGFMLGTAVGLVLGLTDPPWAEAALDELAELLAAAGGRSPSAHRAELWAMARRLIDEAAAIERGESA